MYLKNMSDEFAKYLKIKNVRDALDLLEGLEYVTGRMINACKLTHQAALLSEAIKMHKDLYCYDPDDLDEDIECDDDINYSTDILESLDKAIRSSNENRDLLHQQEAMAVGECLTLWECVIFEFDPVIFEFFAGGCPEINKDELANAFFSAIKDVVLNDETRGLCLSGRAMTEKFFNALMHRLINTEPEHSELVN